MITLLVVVVALLLVNLYAARSGASSGRLLFTLAAVALLVVLCGPAIALLRLPLGQFLALWLFIIPIALVVAVALTLAGLARRAMATFTGSARPARWAGWMPIALAPGLLAAVVLANLALPLRLIDAPIQGVETSIGTVVGGVRYGAAFVGTAHGGMAGTFTATVNYRPALPNPGAVSSIIGGSWSLAVYQGNHYRGTLFGTLTRGTVAWNLDVTVASITADLTIAGGMGDYLTARGHGHFAGTLLHLTFPPTVAGTLTLTVH